MNFDAQDVERGFKECSEYGCKKVHICNAGTDYPDECWSQCAKCYCWVVDPTKEIKKTSSFTI